MEDTTPNNNNPAEGQAETTNIHNDMNMKNSCLHSPNSPTNFLGVEKNNEGRLNSIDDDFSTGENNSQMETEEVEEWSGLKKIKLQY